MVMLLLGILFFILLMESIRGQLNISPYCRFTPLHTLCQNRGYGRDCGSQVTSQVVSPREAALIVSEHNRLRSKVATGQEGRGAPGPQPPAANMMLMEWDEELARVAQSHANQCIFAHECSACRRVSRFGVGQNLFIASQIRQNSAVEWPVAINAWYKEVDEFDPGYIQPYRYSPSIGHYTQLIWHNSYKVGCGFSMYKQGIWWRKLYTCDYGAGGNIIFSQVYMIGEPCSSCPSGTSCSLQYPGLCGYATTFAVPSRRLKEQLKSRPTSDTANATQVVEAKPVQSMVNISESKMPDVNTSTSLQMVANASHKQEATSSTDFNETYLLNLIGILMTCIIGVSPEFYRLCWLMEWYFNSMFFLNPLLGSINQKTFIRPDVIVRCNTDPLLCSYSLLNPSWTVEENSGMGRHAHTILEAGDKAWLMYHKEIAAPPKNTTCLTVSHQRDFYGIVHPNATFPEFTLVVKQQRGETIRVSLDGQPGRWEDTRLSINNIMKPFIVELLIGPANCKVSVAISALCVTDGFC